MDAAADVDAAAFLPVCLLHAVVFAGVLYRRVTSAGFSSGLFPGPPWDLRFLPLFVAGPTVGAASPVYVAPRHRRSPTSPGRGAR